MISNIVRSFFLIVKNTKFDQKPVSLLCVKTKSGAHKQLTFYFQMRKYFCRYLHSSPISMRETLTNSGTVYQVPNEALHARILDLFALLYNQPSQGANDGGYFETVSKGRNI
jgi:hypothetical protein